MTKCDSSVESENVDQFPIKAHVALSVSSNELSPSRRRLSIPYSPTSLKASRLNYKEKRARFRVALGIGDTATIANAEGAAIRNEILTSSNFHYFWCSRFWIWIYAACLFAILSRQPVLLHVITIFTLWHMLERVFAWSAFLATSREARQSVQHIRWVFKFTLGFLEKALEGNRFHGYLTVKTVKFWTGTGKNFLLAFFRRQLHEIRSNMLKDVRDTLRRQDITRDEQR